MEKKEWLQGQSNTPTQVFFWGSDKNGLLGPEKKPTIYSKPQFLNFGVKIDFLACGDEHVAFVADGYLYTMGDNPDGRLGIAKNVKGTSSPCLVETLKKSYIIKVACGAKHSAALTDLGEVFTWGCGENGQLGLKNNQNQQIPQYVRLIHNESKTRNEMSEPAFDISCGSKHTAVVTKPGDVFMFGSNEFGQIGNGGTQDELSPVKINISLQKMQNVACGKNHTLLLTVQGNIYSFGQNSSGELGIGNKQNANVPCRALIPEETKIFKISAGYHSAAISVKGELYVWGESTLGSYVVPRKVPMNNGSEIVGVQMGDSFTALLDRKGYLWNFGNNTTGELGQGDLENHNSIVQVSGLNSVKIKAFSCGKNFGVALADYPSGLKGIKEVQESAESKMKKQSLKQNGRRVNEQPENKDDEEEEKSYDFSNENVEMMESDAEASSDTYQNIPKQHVYGITDSNNKIILELAGQYTSSGRGRDEPSNMKGGVRNFETNMDTETDELREESHTFSTQNQITDSKYEDIWNTHDKEDRIRNILVDIKILRLQNALLEQQLEERSQQIANFRRKMREMAFTGRRTQEREQKMKELILKLEAQSLKFREESLKNSEEIMRKETEIHRLKRIIEEKNGAMDSLVKDNNNLRELVQYLLELRGQERDLSSKDRETYSTLESRIQQILEDLNLAPATGYFSNTQVTETHKTETMQDSYKPREGSIDHQTSLASNSPKSTSLNRVQQKVGMTLNEKYSASFPSRRMSPASKEMYTSNHLHDKEKPISTGLGTHHAEMISTATEEPRISTRVSYAEARAKHQKTHTKSHCSLNLISLISPKNGNTHPTEPSQQKVLASAKQTKNELPVSFHKKKLSEPLLNFRPIPNVIEERNHKDMVNNYFKTLHPSHEKRISTSKDSRNSQSYFQNHLSTPAKDGSKKTGATQISPYNAANAKDKRKPESSQIYRKLLSQHFPAKLSSTAGLTKTGGRTLSNATKQNFLK